MSSEFPGATFRDPAGSLSFEEDRVVRRIGAPAREAVLDFLGSPLCRKLQERGDLIAAEIDDSGKELRLQHPKVPIPTYPWEWTPSQWLAAAELTLTLGEDAIAEGWILKDATPLNVLFLGARPIFVDILSFERRDPRSSVWLAYGQYVRTFLLPLLMNRKLSWPLSLSLFRRDGYEPAELFAAMGWSQRLSRDTFWPVTLPARAPRSHRFEGPEAAARCRSRCYSRSAEAHVDQAAPEHAAGGGEDHLFRLEQVSGDADPLHPGAEPSEAGMGAAGHRSCSTAVGAGHRRQHRRVQRTRRRSRRRGRRPGARPARRRPHRSARPGYRTPR